MNAFSKNCFKAKQCDFILSAAVSVKAQENVTILRFEGRPRGGLPWPLPDWSFAGYAAGKTTPSASPSNFNVLDYGANSSGLQDASDAIQRAINAAASSGNGTVYLPPGRYLLTKPLRITKSKVVIKGAGWDATTILINKPLSAVYNGGGGNSSTVLPPMTTCTTGTSQSPYSWAGGFIRIGGFIPTDRSETRPASVVINASRGLTTLKVDDASRIKVGDWVRLLESDPKRGPFQGTLASKLYGGFVANSSCGNKCIRGIFGQQDLVRWAVRVKNVDGVLVTLDSELPIEVRPEWNPELHSIPEITFPHDCGVSDLKIAFPVTKVKPHLEDDGYNAIAVESAFNSFVRAVKVINADNAVLVRCAYHVTIDNVEIYATGDRGSRDGVVGHIGIGLYNAVNVEVTRFNILSPMYHDITVRGTMLCVFHNGKGTNLNIDSHRTAPYATLYSDLNLGKASRPFTSGGGGNNGFPAAAYTTFWNLKSDRNKAIYIAKRTSFGPCTYGALMAFVGNFHGTPCESYYMRKDVSPQPPDLFTSQQKARLGKAI